MPQILIALPVKLNIDKYWLYVQFAACYCGGCTIAPLTDYTNNEVYQELVREDEYPVCADEKLYLDLRQSKSYTEKLENLETTSI